MLLGEELAGPVSNVLLSENLALLGIIGFLYLIYVWLEEPERCRIYPWIAGGVMGISLLIRADFAATLLAVGGAALIILWKKRKLWLQGAAAVILMVGLIITPWMFRNWQRTGEFYLDKQNIMRSRITEFIDQLMDYDVTVQESLPELDLTSDKMISRWEALSHHVGNSLHQSIIYLPNESHPGLGLGNLAFEGFVRRGGFSNIHFREAIEDILTIHINKSPMYWFEWDGKVFISSVLPTSLVLFILVLGVRYSGKQSPRADLIFAFPLIAHFIIWAIPGFSGNRFVKTVDWMVLILYGIGLTELVVFLIKMYRSDRDPCLQRIDYFKEKSICLTPANWNFKWVEISAVIVLLLIGLSPSILEKAILPKHTYEEMQTIIDGSQVIDENQARNWDQCRKAITSVDTGGAYYGTAIYPRYYQVGEILGNDRRDVHQDSTINRINFYLVGIQNIGVTLPNAGPEMIFPHGTDIIVFSN